MEQTIILMDALKNQVGKLLVAADGSLQIFVSKDFASLEPTLNNLGETIHQQNSFPMKRVKKDGNVVFESVERVSKGHRDYALAVADFINTMNPVTPRVFAVLQKDE